MDEKLNNIKPCPFCGGKGMLIDLNNSYCYYFTPYFVQCKNGPEVCLKFPITDDYQTKNEAIEAWNNRIFDEN